MRRVPGLLLAAGAGRRMGGPKALLRDPDGTPWVVRSAQVLAAGGCHPVLVVVGAAAAEVSALLPAGTAAVPAPDWAEGMGASLRAGLAALTAADAVGPARGTGPDAVLPGAEPDAAGPASGTGPDAVLVGLVDTPGVNAEVVARLVAVAGPDVIARAAYDGRPGHPVLIGRRHWAGVLAVARGDRGAREYLAGRQDVRLVECGDVGHGEDRDRPGGPDVPGR